MFPARLIAALLALVAGSAAAWGAAAPEQQAERLFRTALASAAAGRYGAAETALRQLLAAAPTPRVRLELARVLFLEGRYREARSLFREVYEAPATPQTVKRNILPFMEEAELRSLRIRYGARVVTDTNPSQAAEGGTIYFNGLPLEYQPPVRRKTSYGIEPWLTVEKMWKNGTLARFYASTRLFADGDLDSGRVQVAAARQIASVPGLFVQAALDGGVGKDSSYALPSFETWKRFRLSDTAGIGAGGQIGYMLSQNRDASGAFYRPYVFGNWTFRPNATIFASASLEHLDSRNDYYSYFAPKLDFGLALSVAGVDLVPEVTLGQTRFVKHDPFWGLKRRDATVRYMLTVSSERLEWNGIRPEVSVFLQRRDSNVDIYDYRQAGGFVNLKKLF